MTREQFDAIWVPRLGSGASEVLWRERRRGRFQIAAALPACGGVALLTVGAPIAILLGSVLLLIAVYLLGDFLLGQRRLKAAMSDAFGAPVKGSPLMNPRSFDQWAKYHGYHLPGE